MAKINNVTNLSLRIPAEYQKFVANVTPNEHSNLIAPDSVPFDIELTVPEGTEPGIYEFVVTAIGDGLSYGEHKITINVPATIAEEDPIKESTFGKVTGGGFIRESESSMYSFGFNVHYNSKGKATMKGQLQFSDRNGNKSFHGNEVLRLVVEENKAIFTGTGLLNEKEGFSYKVEVVDNGNPGRGNDTFFIEITKDETGSSMYATGGIIDGGNIKVHEIKPKVKKEKNTTKKEKGKKK